MANRQKQKGDRFEREIAKVLRGERAVLSGGGKHDGDVDIVNHALEWFFGVECKKRAAYASYITDGLDQADGACDPWQRPLLILGADRKPAVAVMYVEDLMRLHDEFAEVYRQRVAEGG